jgi:exodeoxyribonuclease-1
MSQPTFLWHDFETFGADPRRDRPAQFAAVRTDTDLQPIGEPQVVYCRPADDVLPQPMACLITGITPQLARERGLPEHRFAATINEAMSRPDTCSVGYNNFRFDDEVTRYLFWRNFIDPYAREYANGNSRFDLIDLLRMTQALRPDGIEWPRREDGTPSFRLEDLARANGLDTARAHDALADVEATIGMARLVRQRQPRLWEWALGLRGKHRVAGMLQPGQPLLHSSARFPASRFCTAPVLPLVPHPRFSGQWVLWNLNVDPTPFFDLASDELGDRLWTAERDLPDGVERLPIKLVRSNRCPMLSPLSVLDDKARERLGVDLLAVERHTQALQSNDTFQERIGALFSDCGKDSAADSAPDPELALYDGFAPREDQRLYPCIRELDADGLARVGSPFRDSRLNELLFRYRARLFPDSLNTEERQRWETHRLRRLVHDPDLASIRLPEFKGELAELSQRRSDASDLAILKQLAEWPSELPLSDDHQSVS